MSLLEKYESSCDNCGITLIFLKNYYYSKPQYCRHNCKLIVNAKYECESCRYESPFKEIKMGNCQKCDTYKIKLSQNPYPPKIERNKLPGKYHNSKPYFDWNGVEMCSGHWFLIYCCEAHCMDCKIEECYYLGINHCCCNI